MLGSRIYLPKKERKKEKKYYSANISRRTYYTIRYRKPINPMVSVFRNNQHKGEKYRLVAFIITIIVIVIVIFFFYSDFKCFKINLTVSFLFYFFCSIP